jgi:hypothetical protein
MDEGCGQEDLPRRLLSQAVDGEITQLIVPHGPLFTVTETVADAMPFAMMTRE